VTVGKSPSVEDAVFVDLDGDRRLDVVSCCEGRTRTMFVHWAPSGESDYLDPSAWITEPLPASVDRMMWMFCIPMQVDGRDGVDLVAAGKGSEAEIGWWQAPADPRDLNQWQWHGMSTAGWIMSLLAVDMDGDQDLDVLATDRRGEMRGCRWLENPGPGARQHRAWPNHFVGGRDREVMFMTWADLDADGRQDAVAATSNNGFLFFRRSGVRDAWQSFTIDMPAGVGTGKAVAVADLDENGRPDLVFSCERATGDKHGIVWLSFDAFPKDRAAKTRSISGPLGIKFDRLEVLDIDEDGDLDVLACEESAPVEGKRRGLGVVWYENPLRQGGV
jgi:hypothetical protein